MNVIKTGKKDDDTNYVIFKINQEDISIQTNLCFEHSYIAEYKLEQGSPVMYLDQRLKYRDTNVLKTAVMIVLESLHGFIHIGVCTDNVIFYRDFEKQYREIVYLDSNAFLLKEIKEGMDETNRLLNQLLGSLSRKL